MTRDELLNPHKRDDRARRYLRSKEKPPTNGTLRAGLAFGLLAAAILVIVLAL
jgi:hypothetical protein